MRRSLRHALGMMLIGAATSLGLDPSASPPAPRGSLADRLDAALAGAEDAPPTAPARVSLSRAELLDRALSGVDDAAIPAIGAARPRRVSYSPAEKLERALAGIEEEAPCAADEECAWSGDDGSCKQDGGPPPGQNFGAEWGLGCCWHFQAGAEFLFWRVQAMPDVPLFTTNPGGADGNGSLGQTATRIANPSLGVDYEFKPGMRVHAALSLEGERCGVGLEARAFFLQENGGTQPPLAVDSRTILARPVINALTGEETVQFVAAPDQFTGTGSVQLSSRLRGADATASFWPVGYEYEFLAGATYLDLDEQLTVGQNSSLLSGGLVAFNGATIMPPASVALRDTFRASNRFQGGHVGLRFTTHHFDPMFLQLMGRVSVGRTREEVSISGGSTLNGTQTQPGGLLALASNSGTRTRDVVAYVPEFSANIGFHFGSCVKLSGGYSLLYWSQVVRPSSVIDRAINPALLPTSILFGVAGGPARPAVPFRQTDLFVHGLNLGLEFLY